LVWEAGTRGGILLQAYDTLIPQHWLMPSDSSVVDTHFYSKMVDRIREFEFVKNIALCNYSFDPDNLLCVSWVCSQNWRRTDHAVPAPFEVLSMPKDLSITKQVLQTRSIRIIEPNEDVIPLSPGVLMARTRIGAERVYYVPLRTDSNKLFGSFAFDVPANLVLSSSICDRLLMSGEYLALYLDSLLTNRCLRERTRDLNLVCKQFDLIQDVGEWISTKESSLESVGKAMSALRGRLKATTLSVWVPDETGHLLRCLSGESRLYDDAVGQELILSDREFHLLRSLPKQGALMEEEEEGAELSTRFLEKLNVEHIKSTFAIPLFSSQNLVGVLFAGSTHSAFFQNRATTGTLAALSHYLAVGLSTTGVYQGRLGTRASMIIVPPPQLPSSLRPARRPEPPAIIGKSKEISQLLERVETVSRTTVPVLLLGETGTGKDLIARALHHGSPRRDQPFVTLNCAAIPAGLIESELFGHEKGAFTGAITRTAGYFEQAHEGTLFLDEIGDLPLELQTKLLRVLQDRTIQRIGGLKKIEVDVRIIAATHRDLRAMVTAGTFREDLYYRLNVFPVRIPPLRERRDDIPLLVSHFVTDSCKELGRSPLRVELQDVQRLTMYPWPGNIRELENVIKRAVVCSTGKVLNVECLDETVAPAANGDLKDEKTWNAIERETIIAAIRKAKRRIAGRSGAAELLGLKRTTLNSKMKRLGIKLEDI
jgi:transcriptional regulator with GAF, ATPase, and Fis domain